MVYLDAPKDTFEAIAAWRALGRGKVGRRELLVKVIEVDGHWDETVMQEPAPPPPLPRPKLTLRRYDVGIFGAIKNWLGFRA